MPRLAPLIVLLSSLALTACDRSGWRITHRLAVAVDSPTTPIELAQVAPFPWDRMCVLGPYSGGREARALLGFDWDVDDKSRIGGLDTINLLLFVQGTQVVAHAEHPRGQGDFMALAPRCLDRAAARLRRVAAPGQPVRLLTEAQAAGEGVTPASPLEVPPPASAASDAAAGSPP